LKQIGTFLLLAFVLPLFCVLLMLNTALFHSGAFNLVAYGIEAAAPALAAIVTVLYFEKGRGLRHFLKSAYLDNLHPKIILLALLLPVVLVGVPKLLNGLLFGGGLHLGILAPKKILIICWALVAEELGWRGFLQQKLRPYLNDFTLPLAVGLIWAVWHYHYFLSGASSAPLLLFVLSCVTDSYLYFAVTRFANGNIVPASVLHFSGNLCFNLFLINPEHNGGSLVPYLLYVLCSLITAVLAFSVTRRREEKLRQT